MMSSAKKNLLMILCISDKFTLCEHRSVLTCPTREYVYPTPTLAMRARLLMRWITEGYINTLAKSDRIDAFAQCKGNHDSPTAVDLQSASQKDFFRNFFNSAQPYFFLLGADEKDYDHLRPTPRINRNSRRNKIADDRAPAGVLVFSRQALSVRCQLFIEPQGRLCGNAAKRQDIGSGVSAQTVAAVHAAGDLTCGIQSLDDIALFVEHLCLGVDVQAAHRMMDGRSTRLSLIHI